MDGFSKLKVKNILESLSIHQAMALARRKVKENLPYDALDICEDILEKFPMHRGSKNIIKDIRSDPSSNLLAEETFQQGNSLYQRGDLEEALIFFKKSVRICPDHFKSYFNMAVVFQNTGYLVDAIENYLQVLRYKPSSSDVYSNVGAILRDVRFAEYEPKFDAFFLEILEEGNYARPSEICHAAVSLLREKPRIQSILKICKSQEIPDKLTKILESLSKESLFLKLMSLCPITDLEFEKMLTDIRAAILQNIQTLSYTPSLVQVLSAIATQCFTNEYIYKKTSCEDKALTEIESGILEKIIEQTQVCVPEILVMACYKPLQFFTWNTYIHQTVDLASVVEMQIDQVEKDQKSARSIKTLKEISNAISVDVQEQYEASPYPRWIDLRLERVPLTIREVARRARLRISNESIFNCILPEVLIAGCGTGQQSIEAGSKFKNSEIVAVDLSATSLAYASRKTNEFGMTNINYMQADILDLYNLDQKFDVIECCGVLHHMDNPFEGWQALTKCLKPGGLMKIALYSKKARASVNTIRKEIAELGIYSDLASIKGFRELVIESKKQDHKAVRSFADFYCLSELRDLLFHVKEHQFSIPEIEQMLKKLKLNFCGFESDRALNAFISKNSLSDKIYNLSAWNIFENQNLDVFSGMYQFWCQKRNDT